MTKKTKQQTTLVNPQLVLNEMITDYYKKIKEEENKLVQFALDHGLNLYLGEYGIDGRTLIHGWSESGTAIDANGDDLYVSSSDVDGHWVYSSQTC